MARWVVDFVRQPERRGRVEAERRRRDDARWYVEAQAFLAERDIRPGDNGFSVEILMGELGRRGWQWEFAPGGKGYEAHAEKRWFPSSSHSIRFSAPAPEEVFVKVLAAAIQEDEFRQKATTGTQDTQQEQIQ